MTFDVIVIGGGLSALTCGIALATGGKRVALMVKSTGKLSYNPGSIDLLGMDTEGNVVENPLAAIEKLPPQHPYSKLTAADVAHNVAMVPVLLSGAGLSFDGDFQATQNHFRITPMGLQRPSWLTLSDFLKADDVTAASNVAVVNLEGFLDFPAQYVTAAMEGMGASCRTLSLKLNAIEKLTNAQSVVRSTAVAKLMQNDGVMGELTRKLKSEPAHEDLLVMPAVMGLDNSNAVERLKSELAMDVKLVSTLPPTMGGNLIATSLRRLFIKHGGTFLLGSMVKDGVLSNNMVTCVHAKNFPDQDIQARCYVLATGSFMSGGLVADNRGVKEPIFNLDIDMAGTPATWTGECLFDAQPFMLTGVKTDNRFRAIKDGNVIENLYATGSILSGHNSIKLADDSGVAMLTALQVAREISTLI